MNYSLYLPQGWITDLTHIYDPIEAYEAMTDVAQVADETGYASIWLVDHFHTVPPPSQAITFEAWMSTAALARDTKRIRIGQMVTCQGYRHPALLAKMASTVDVLSHGRLTLGIGAGSYEQEHRAYGYSCPTPSFRLLQLAEAVQIILKMWTEEEAHFEGAYYHVRSAINQPKGIQQPHIPLLIGGSGEKVTLKLVAQFANACNIDGSLSTLERKLSILKQHCERVGRDYQSIYRTSNAPCFLADTDEEALMQIPEQMKRVFGPNLATMPIGSPETVRQRIAAYEAIGIQELVLRFIDPFKLFELCEEEAPKLLDTGLRDPLQLASIRRFAKEFISG